jgi:hypothetical protein
MGSVLRDLDEENTYLTEKGWEFNGSGWIDPRTKEPPKTVEMGRTKQLSGEVSILKQTIRPPMRFAHATEQAIFIQKQRDYEEKKRADSDA